MKIVKKPTFPIQKCKSCGCEFEINAKDLRNNQYNELKCYVKCPICKDINYALFELDLEQHNKQNASQ